ncbi:MAG TPA: ATP-dependent helicase, partial [Methanomicrobia archaeon]|nr:ATP-dependent helicase [Methanomicrobia archaeon]
MASNQAQEEVIRTTEGILLVDAGPGTGKTYTITKRYISILDNDPEATPEDILLLTFSNNAADNMKRKVMSELTKRDPATLWDAKISTFHAFCKSILTTYTYKVPSLLGYGERLSPSFSILENDVGEHMFFSKVYNAFYERNKDVHREMVSIVGDNSDQVLRIIKQLLSKGIFPTRDDWFLDGRSHLEGDWESFCVRMRVENTCPMGKKGPTQARMLKRLKTRRANKIYLDASPTLLEGKNIPEGDIREAFHEDREKEISFIHDIYLFYIKRAIRAGMLPFDFLIMLVFLILHDDDDIRRSVAFDYVMVDEFQDTNEMQFMLTLLLMKSNNLCAVGDWKQGIYGFRYASIDNILEFQERIGRYKAQLNEGRTRIHFPVDVEAREFTINYRSTQTLLDTSFGSLYIEATNEDAVEAEALGEAITPLVAHREEGHLSDVRFYTADDNDAEVEMIIALIQDMMADDKVRIIDEGAEGGCLRPIRYEDIAVLSRTRDFGLRLQGRAAHYGVPVVFEGGTEIFNS